MLFSRTVNSCEFKKTRIFLRSPNDKRTGGKFVGFTLQAKLVSSKHLIQVHLKISSRTLENLASHLVTKYTLEAQAVNHRSR